MDLEKQVEISVVLGYGDFSLRLNGVTMNVRVQNANGDGSTANLGKDLGISAANGALQAPAVLPDPTASDPVTATHLTAEANYYRQASQEIYAGLGKLAKEIYLSLQDISMVEILQTGKVSPGERLHQVRSQVTDVMEMTEKATLNILNLVEQIQEDCLEVQGHLRQLSGGNLAPLTAAPSESPAALALCSRLLTQGEAIDRLIRVHFQEGDSPEAPVSFQLRDVLQILLEFCGAEAVKPHLKSVLGQYENLFRVDEAEQGL